VLHDFPMEFIFGRLGDDVPVVVGEFPNHAVVRL
jgi:hypothetical protein